MTEYKVEHDGRHFRVRGLKDRRGGEDQLLLHHIPYPETEWPEVEDPGSGDKMHGALYDLYQWHEGLKEGDAFMTPFGRFECKSIHVVRSP